MLQLLAIYSYFLLSQSSSKLVITATDSVRMNVFGELFYSQDGKPSFDTLLCKGQRMVIREMESGGRESNGEYIFNIGCSDFRRVSILLNNKPLPLSLLTDNFSKHNINISNSEIARVKAYKKERDNEKKIAEELKRKDDVEAKRNSNRKNIESTSEADKFIDPWSVVHPEMKGKKLNWNQGCNCWLDPILDMGFRYIDVDGDKSKKKWVRIR